MTHEEHVRLIQDGIEGHVWADMGSGAGAFTLALAELLGSEAKIYSVDRDGAVLAEQKKRMEERFPETKTEYIVADMVNEVDLPVLDGILAANSIHFVNDRIEVLRLFRSYLASHGRLLVVEYNTDSGNDWVPHAFSFETFEKEAKEVGFEKVELLETSPSQFLGEIYSAVAYQ